MRTAGVLGALLLTLVVGAVGAPAGAASQPVQLSTDGRVWTPDLTTPLFDPSVRWVPGDVRTATFWVRNAGPSLGALTITANVHDDDALLAGGAILLRMRAAGGAWTTVRPGTAASLGSLARGARSRIEMTASFAWPSGSDTQRKLLRFGLDVRLSGASTSVTHGTNQEPAEDHHGSGLLPNTGNPVTWRLCLLAALSLGGGTGLVVRSKRRERR